ncbi:Neuronal PAS domain protein [Quillaja saponaria]|uniref:Neuronal PAS domain protein n=1 Tax=Quillaja saponaria TaxID=32244 RepID=A0AAD7LK04_QUISA|nr:Neuronal PAS domain protein [Quillaja saponaria]
MANSTFPNVFFWIQNLPPLSQWKTSSMSICLFTSGSSQPSINLNIARNNQSPTLSFGVVANFNNLSISLWTSKPLNLSSKSLKLIDEKTISNLLANLIEDILHYGTNNNFPSIKFPKLDSVSNFPEMFNFAFLTLSFLICIYEAPTDLRSGCLNTFKNNLTCCRSRQTSKLLMKLLGSNLEEQWMRSVNLAITNWIVELKASHHILKTPSPLFSYANSSFGLWKVQLYCPVIAMDVVNSNNHSADERLQFSLNYHQLEGVIQFNNKVSINEKWVDVMVNIDNIRCDVIKLVNDTLMNERGVGAAEKHFPSRISLQLIPTMQTHILSVSVSKSSDNPLTEIGIEKSIEASFEPANPYLGLTVSAGETTTTRLKPWKFEESVYGYSANLNWFLHDSMDGKEVFSSKPSKVALFNPKSWFRDRYSSAHRPFTRQGGIIFAGDEYGDRVWWKVDRNAVGKTMEWEIRGWIWLTYWPNKIKTFYNETRRLEFRESLHLNIVA